jgi:GR25 family glycosyltransferase involved in LPS biosynthesis
LAAGLQLGSSREIAQLFNFESVANAGNAILQNFNEMTASGGEGYLISRNGAGKILKIFQRKGVFMEVDWFLFFHSMSLHQRKLFFKKDATGRFDMLEFDSMVLDSAVLLPALLEQLCLKSTIAFEKPQNYVSREKMRNVFI